VNLQRSQLRSASLALLAAMGLPCADAAPVQSDQANERMRIWRLCDHAFVISPPDGVATTVVDVGNSLIVIDGGGARLEEIGRYIHELRLPLGTVHVVLLHRRRTAVARCFANAIVHFTGALASEVGALDNGERLAMLEPEDPVQVGTARLWLSTPRPRDGASVAVVDLPTSSVASATGPNRLMVRPDGPPGPFRRMAHPATGRTCHPSAAWARRHSVLPPSTIAVADGLVTVVGLSSRRSRGWAA
jgi:hypothetical protein